MKRSSRFVVGFAAAALTFGSLFAFVGPKHFHGCEQAPCHRHHHDNGRCSDNKDTLQMPADEKQSEGSF